MHKKIIYLLLLIAFYRNKTIAKTKNEKSVATAVKERSVIQLGELKYANGIITVDRDEPVQIKLKNK